ncbi:SURF1 family cytochrome oxidase biogenesis protein [Novosphingobium sp. PS1R-30]|uniref:SURF1-like protein n=1 Tax=Novosphingobium anseongense TaxID=3133436 RepID=A0ABU8S0V9_9SPHN
MRRLPIFASLLVLAAVGVMIRLGFWQLDRLHQKEALLTRYAQASGLSADVPFPRDARAAESVLYRHARIDCAAVRGVTVTAGHNAKGETGMANIADCTLAGGGQARVVIGWSRNPLPGQWQGGPVSGIIAPGPRLVADPPLAGLEANARPDPGDLPNNHLAYAVQWFLFALTALVIYVLAIRKRLRRA